MKEIRDLEGTRNAWATAIGQALVAFGDIEHVTVLCLRELPRDRIQRSVQSFRLGQRIDLLVEILEVNEHPFGKDLSVKLLRAKDLAKLRNIVAHSPLMMEIYQRGDGSIYARDVVSGFPKGGRRLSLKDVQQLAVDAAALASELYDCVSVYLRAVSANPPKNQDAQESKGD